MKCLKKQIGRTFLLLGILGLWLPQYTGAQTVAEGHTWPPEPTSYISAGLTPEGNRFLDVHIDLRQARYITVSLGAPPFRIAGYKSKDGYTWYAVLKNGKLRTIRVRKGRSEAAVSAEKGTVPRFSPVLVETDSSFRPLPLSSYKGNYLTYPVPSPDGRGTVAVSSEGKILHSYKGKDEILAENALPDTRFIRMGMDLYYLSGPTTRYRHGALGDEYEASDFSRIRFSGGKTPYAETISAVSADAVIESLSLIGLPNLPGTEALILTVSSPGDGSRIVLATPDGEPIAEGEPIGRSSRWRHTLTAAPLGSNGELEIATVKTPHIGGVLEYYRPNPASSTGQNKQSLEIVHIRTGYSTHKSGSRNLDTAAAGDFNDDGRYDLLLPNQGMDSLVNVQRTASGSRENYRIPLGAELSSNLSVVEDETWTPAEGEDRSGAAAVGTTDGTLHIWVP